MADDYEYDPDDYQDDDGLEYEHDDDGGGAFGGGEEELPQDVALREVDNGLFEAEELIYSDLAAAVESFQSVLAKADAGAAEHDAVRGDLREKGFSACEWLCTLLIRAGRLTEFTRAYRQPDAAAGPLGLLDRINERHVPRSAAETAINKVLGAIGTAAAAATAVPAQAAGGAGGAASSSSSSGIDPIAQTYADTIEALDSGAGEPPALVFNLHLRLARHYAATRQWSRVEAALTRIRARFGLDATEEAILARHSSGGSGSGAGAGATPRAAAAARAGSGSGSGSGGGGGGDDVGHRSSQLMEVYALRIEAAGEAGNRKAVREAWEAAERLTAAAVPSPFAAGVIGEAGGKVSMWEGNTSDARGQFLEAFRAFESAGADARAIACLRYHVIANMLCAQPINVWAPQETQPYKKEASMQALTALTEAHLSGDLATFERVIRTVPSEGSGNGSSGAGASASAASAAASSADSSVPVLVVDAFSGPFIGDLLTSMRTKALLALLPSYTRVRLSFLAREMNMRPEDVDSLVAGLVLDGRLSARIDQVAGVVVMLPPQQRVTATGTAGASAPDVAASADASRSMYAALARLSSKLQGIVAAIPAIAVGESQAAQGGKGRGRTQLAGMVGALGLDD